MATDVLSLFNMPTQEQIGRSYLEGMLTSPAQMGSQGLLQQVVSLGGNAGAGIGYGVGRLMGGMTADEVRAKSIDDAMRVVQGMGLTSDAEMYGALSQELARRGLTQDALQARNAGLKSLQAEEQMRLNKQQGDINLAELGTRMDKAAREAELFPLQVQKAKLDITKLEEEQKTTEEQLAEALDKGQTARAQGLQRRLDMFKQEIEFKKRELDIRSRQAEASMVSAQAQAERAAAAADNEKYTIPVYAESTFPGTKGDIIGRQNKQGQVLGNDGYVYRSINELKAAINPKADTGGDNKGGVKPNAPSLADLRAKAGAAGQQQSPAPVQPQAPVASASLDQALEKELEEMRQGNRLNFSPEVGAYYKQRRAEQRRQEEEAYLAAERQRQLRGQR